MSTTSYSSKDQPHQHRSPHDWDSHDYVTKWAEGQDQKEVDRQEPFRLLAQTMPYDKQLPIKILDVGAGYGALSQFLLKHFPNATAICQDNSQEMTELGKKRMENIKGRFTYVHCDFREMGWSRVVRGPFEAVVSSIAIHNARSADIMRNIYRELFPLLKTGG